MNICIIKNNEYPKTDLHDVTFFLLGNHKGFFENVLEKINKYKYFFSQYEVSSDNDGVLELKNVKSSHIIKDRYVTTREFILSGCQKEWCNEIIQKNDNITNYDTIIIQDITYFEKKIWKRLLFVNCPEMKNSSYEIFLINPFVIKNNTDIFKNLILRSSINYFIFDNYAPLKKILTHIYPSFNIEKTYIYINFNEINNIKIIKKCYHRNKIRAFVYAWFNFQICENNEIENEKVKKKYNDLYSLI